LKNLAVHFLLLVNLAVVARASDASGAVHCIEWLPLPPYPVLARQAQIAGTVRAQLVVSNKMATALKIGGAHKVLLDAVGKSIRKRASSPTVKQ